MGIRQPLGWGVVLALAVALTAGPCMAAGGKDADHKDVVAAFFAALNEKDPARRDGMIARSFAENGVFCDSAERAEGAKAIGRRMEALQHAQAEYRYQPFGAVDRQYDALRFAFEVVDRSGTTAFEGMIFAVLANDGRLARVNLFTGPAAAPLP